ncbi:DUF6011 domain-containing protein [Streptomyces subrutilus]|uniref:Uncharacterized protein n=1 Tax=Streptomyces subrutilus TaxID=36818 RepID=A0A1E5NXQ2_9ACTN|nr:DUF6011 domain-containing protein [Streptomyces subrutilus]OEJ20902.1 hypothetical protein BGK67_35295 [Streptomyces subrutilus]
MIDITALAAAVKAAQQLTPGLYHLEGKVYRVSRTRRGVVKVERLLQPGPRGGNGRFVPDYSTARQELADEHKLTKEAAEAYGKEHGLCAACGRLLTDPVSVARGIGPVCLKHFS